MSEKALDELNQKLTNICNQMGVSYPGQPDTLVAMLFVMLQSKDKEIIATRQDREDWVKEAKAVAAKVDGTGDPITYLDRFVERHTVCHDVVAVVNELRRSHTDLSKDKLTDRDFLLALASNYKPVAVPGIESLSDAKTSQLTAVLLMCVQELAERAITGDPYRRSG